MRDAFANPRLEDTKEPVWLDERQHSKYVTASRDPGGWKEPAVSRTDRAWCAAFDHSRVD